MSRIWNCLSRGFPLRPPATPSQTSTQRSDDTENSLTNSVSEKQAPVKKFLHRIKISQQKNSRSILVPDNKLIISGQNEQDQNKHHNYNHDSFGCSGKTTDNIIYGAASAMLLSQIIRYVGTVFYGNVLNNAQDGGRNVKKLGWKFLKPSVFTAQGILPKLPSIGLPSSTVYAAGGKEEKPSQPIVLTKVSKLTNDACSSNLPRKPEILISDDDREEFLSSTKECLGMTYNIQGIKSYKSGNYHDAFQYFKIGSEGGSQQAQFNLAICYQQGKGTKQNLQQAKKEYNRAARQGHKVAQYNLALLLLEETGLINVKRALFLLEKAAESGLVQAQTLVGSYFAQDGVHHNMKKAVKMFKLAADQEDPLSTYHLAECYEHGLGGLKVDNAKAFELYAAAASLGHKEARFKMAMILLNGCPEIEKNEELAMEILKKGRDEGHEGCAKKYDELMHTSVAKLKTASVKNHHHTTAREAPFRPANVSPFAELFTNMSRFEGTLGEQLNLVPSFCNHSPSFLPFHRVTSLPTFALRSEDTISQSATK